MFRLDRTMEVYLQAYVGSTMTQPATESALTQPATPRPLVAFVDFQNGSKVVETRPVQAVTQGDSRLGVTPLNLKVKLLDLQPGEYQL